MTVVYGDFGRARMLSRQEGHPVAFAPGGGGMPEDLVIAPVVDFPALIQPRALEHVQTGANIIARHLGERVTVTSLVGADYFMKSVVGAGSAYIAGRTGMSDFSDSLAAIVTTNEEDEGEDTLVAAHMMYGAYCVGRELLRSIVLSSDPAFRQKLDSYRERHPSSPLYEAQQAVYHRVAATLALVGVKDVLSRRAQRRLLGAVNNGEFPRHEASVADDFRYHIGSAPVCAMITRQ